MKTELEQIKTEFNERIDALLKKAEVTERLNPKQEFEKFIDGGWIFYGASSTMLYRITIKGKDVYAQGIEMSEPKHLCSDIFNTFNCRPATESEIFDALKKEAEKRGFKEGVSCESLIHNRKLKINQGATFSYLSDFDKVHYGIDEACYVVIYEKGKWATIVKDEAIKIGGYEVKFYPMGETRIDGNLFTKAFWLFAKTISEHSKASVYVGCSAKTEGSNKWMVSLETINQILDKLK